jgi:hypothetical protein
MNSEGLGDHRTRSTEAVTVQLFDTIRLTFYKSGKNGNEYIFLDTKDEVRELAS